MPINYPPEIIAALEAREIELRELISIFARDRETGETVEDGYYSDSEDITCEVIDPETGATVQRTFYASAGYIARSDITFVSNVSVQMVELDFSAVADRVNDLLRGYDVKQAPVQIFEGLLNPQTREFVAPPRAIFVGFVDEVKINTNLGGEQSKAVLTCTSHTQEFTRANADTRSDASQKVRDEDDDFYIDTDTVSEWPVRWGMKEGKVGKKK